MPPATNETMYAAAIGSPVGPLRLLASDRGVVAVLWPGDRRYPAVEAGPGHPLLAEAEGQLAEYFRGARREFTLPLDLRGTPFQRAVWQALRSIPYGATATYGGLAAGLGRPAAARAVGAANGQNPLSIVVPCHRVVGAAGQLTGFAGGLETKALLLEHERGWDRKGGWDHGRGWDRKGGLDRKGGWDRKGRYVAVDAQGRLPL